MIDIGDPSDIFTPTPLENLPTLDSIKEDKTEDLRLKMAEMGKKNLYYLCKVILGYTELNPRVHMPMCDYYDSTRGVYLRRTSLMPRSHFKSTIWNIAETILDIVNNPNIRILMIADTGMNAQRFMLEVQQHFKFNPVFQWVYSKLIPENFNNIRWNTNEMEVPRTIIAREPTVDAIGALGGSESRHYDKIRADDLFTEKCIRSEVERDKLIEWADGLESLLIAQNTGQIDFIGSRKMRGDLYEKQIASYEEGCEVETLGPYVELHGDMVVFCRNVIEDNKPIFPEQISMRFLTRLKRTNPERYWAQYANSPKAAGLNTFDTKWLRVYKWVNDATQISCVENGEELLRISPWAMDRIILFDPSVAERKTSSKNAIIVVAKGSSPFRIVLETHIGHYPPDEAINLLFDLQKKWQPSLISIEKRGFQGWVKYALNEIAELRSLPYLPVIEWPPAGAPNAQWSKTEHIRALQPIVRSNNIWLAEDQTDLWELFEFYPSVRWDDGLDALAQGLTYWPYSIDEVDVSRKKSDELEWLDAMAMGLSGSTDDYKKPWSEEEFLGMFDSTGYGIKEA